MKIVVMRAGSWGATLAGVLSRNGHEVTLVAPNEALRTELLTYRENRSALPGVRIPEEISIVPEPDDALPGAEMVLFPGPCSRMREMARSAAAVCSLEGKILVTAAKGIENETLLRMSQVLANELGQGDDNAIVALSGPSFARFVGLEHPTTVVAASTSREAATAVQGAFNNSVFRVYASRDITGVELGGSLKNVIALAAGMSDGLGLGDNTRAALITRGLAEITRLGIAMGADAETFAGLSGMGDLVLTCSGKESRNHTVGEKIAGGQSLEDVLQSMVTVAEGVNTTKSTVALAGQYDVEMPIAQHVHAVLFESITPRNAVVSLMTRDPKPEH